MPTQAVMLINYRTKYHSLCLTADFFFHTYQYLRQQKRSISRCLTYLRQQKRSVSCYRTDFRQQTWVYSLLPYRSQTADMGLCPAAIPISDSRLGSMSSCLTDLRQQTGVYVKSPYRSQTADWGLFPVALPISDSSFGSISSCLPISDSSFGSISSCLPISDSRLGSMSCSGARSWLTLLTIQPKRRPYTALVMASRASVHGTSKQRNSVRNEAGLCIRD